MTKQELRKGAKAWCWWMSRSLYYTGREITRGGVHYYIFKDIADAIAEITDEQLAKLRTK